MPIILEWRHSLLHMQASLNRNSGQSRFHWIYIGPSFNSTVCHAAGVTHVRTDDKTSYGTLREKNHVCGNVTLRAGLVSCVHLQNNGRACETFVSFSCEPSHLIANVRVFFGFRKLFPTFTVLHVLKTKTSSSDSSRCSNGLFPSRKRSLKLVRFIVVDE